VHGASSTAAAPAYWVVALREWRACTTGVAGPRMIKVLVADDHDLVRDALRHRLSQEADLRVVAVCADGDQVVPAAVRTVPDVAILDLTMARVGGLDAARELLAALPDVHVILLTARLDTVAVRSADRIGIAGYVLKDDDPDDLPSRVRSVAAGGTAWSAAAGALLTEVRRLPG
jgi:DNA-binding NarL/FixJ family response regulator